MTSIILSNILSDSTGEEQFLALKYLSDIEYRSLKYILDTITTGRLNDGKTPFNNYYICNTDEPYAEIVHGIILYGETVKEIISQNENKS